MFTLSQVQMTILGGICSYPTTLTGLTVLPPLVVSFFAEPLLFVFGALLVPCNVLPLVAAALKLPFSELLLPSSGSPPASFPALPSLFELVPVTEINQVIFSFWEGKKYRKLIWSVQILIGMYVYVSQRKREGAVAVKINKIILEESMAAVKYPSRVH